MGVHRRSVRRIVLWLACPASLVLALLVVWWSQQTGARTLSTAQVSLVLGLIVLPGATGAAVLIDRAAARRAARAGRTTPLTSSASAPTRANDHAQPSTPRAADAPTPSTKVHAADPAGRTPHTAPYSHNKPTRAN